MSVPEPPDGVSPVRRLLSISVGLVYLVAPVLGVMQGEVTGARAAWACVALVAFAAAYAGIVLSQRTFGRPGRWTYPLLGFTTVLAVVLPPIFGSGWLALPVYMSVAFAMALPKRAAVVAVAAMGVTLVALGVVTDADPGTLIMFVFQVATLAVLFTNVRNTRLLVSRLREAQGEVARLAAGEERLRIARDLHDLLGHSLSLIAMKAELAGRLAEESPRALREIRDIEEVARQALVEVREAVTGYRQRGLAEAVDGARAALESAGTDTLVRLTGTPLPPALDGLLAWAVREGGTNVLRHSGARHCEITVTYDGVEATLEITDDGRGHAGHAASGEAYGLGGAVAEGKAYGLAGPVAEREAYGLAGPVAEGEAYRLGGPAAEGEGNGLAGLAERVAAAGGTMTAGRVRGGFRLAVRVPVPADPGAPAEPGTQADPNEPNAQADPNEPNALADPNAPAEPGAAGGGAVTPVTAVPDATGAERT
ncbi:sensor histidine kinase [Nonomuraea sp. SMC257]|uniref:Sensor histidine kinase n=1 Tax=Nonomuraea montanisoli TaxID=2741721 RepID=A0A7Y6M797_9ACTN|nr:histidine kinase [Nonomuraea montanisoli]NUW37202.1 sensor histidine kinase [Nonomuraea montanisoli]